MSDPTIIQSCARCKHRPKHKINGDGDEHHTLQWSKVCEDCIQPIVHKNFELDADVFEEEEEE